MQTTPTQPSGSCPLNSLRFGQSLTVTCSFEKGELEGLHGTLCLVERWRMQRGIWPQPSALTPYVHTACTGETQGYSGILATPCPSALYCCLLFTFLSHDVLHTAASSLGWAPGHGRISWGLNSSSVTDNDLQGTFLSLRGPWFLSSCGDKIPTLQRIVRCLEWNVLQYTFPIITEKYAVE